MASSSAAASPSSPSPSSSSSAPSPSSSLFKNPLAELLRQFRQLNRRELCHQLMTLVLIVCSAYMIFKGLVSLSGTESPVVVVISGSMEPAFYRGDILVLWKGEEKFDLGEIVVFKLKDKETPIVHRVVEINDYLIAPPASNSSSPLDLEKAQSVLEKEYYVQVLTKGDANAHDDRAGIYPSHPKQQLWLEKEDLVGRAVGYLPLFGYITIKLAESPLLKYGLISIMGVIVLLSKE